MTSISRSALTLSARLSPSLTPLAEPLRIKLPDPSSSSDVAVRLFRYLTKRFGAKDLHYQAKPRPVTDGLETYIYHFQLKPNPALPPAFSGPLTLRLFSGPRGIPQGRHQFVVQRLMNEMGYPVPAPVCWEENCDSLGGPFAIMDQVVGPTFVKSLVYKPWHLFGIASKMAELHAWLHILPTQPFPHTGGDLLERSLDELGQTIDDHELNGLRGGLDWLRNNRPGLPPEGPRILHLDFHPLNLIERPNDSPVVLDWDSADLGDPHADVATTLMLIATATNPGVNPWERTMVWGGRYLLTTLYLGSYRKWLPLDSARLNYYGAWAALRRLSRYGKWFVAGPEATGAKKGILSRILPGQLKRMCNYFRQRTHVDVRL